MSTTVRQTRATTPHFRLVHTDNTPYVTIIPLFGSGHSEILSPERLRELAALLIEFAALADLAEPYVDPSPIGD